MPVGASALTVQQLASQATTVPAVRASYTGGNWLGLAIQVGMEPDLNSAGNVQEARSLPVLV